MKREDGVSARERARLIYLRSGKKKTLHQIADELGVPLPNVKNWKRRDKWDGEGAGKKESKKDSKKNESESEKESKNESPKKRKRGGQPGNKNALLNPGGGAPPGNHNALSTGEYARLLYCDLSPEEQALMASVPEDTILLMRHDLALLCVRERRMLARIVALESGNLTPTVQDKILSIEDGLTRVRREKQRIIAAINDHNEKHLLPEETLNEMNRRMMTFADLLNHPAQSRDLSELEGQSGG